MINLEKAFFDVYKGIHKQYQKKNKQTMPVNEG